MKNPLMVLTLSICIMAGFSSAFAPEPVSRDINDVDREEFQKIRRQFLKGESMSRARFSHLLESPQNLRDYDAVYYRIDLDVDDVAETIGGDVTMAARSRIDSLTAVDVDFYDNMQIDSIISGGQGVGFTRSDNVLTVTLPSTVNQGQLFYIRVFYSGRPESYGFVGSFEWDRHFGTPIIWTLSQTDFSRTWWPCNDNTADKADSVDIYLTVDDELVATSQGTLESVVDNGDGTRTFFWKERYPISTYLVSLAITNYESFTEWYVSAGGDSMPVTFYVYPEHYDEALIDFSVVVPMIEYYVSVFGEYPFLTEKYAHSSCPFPGGMEHQTNTSYGSMLITGNNAFDWLTAHEAAHMWWGDMVTCETWEDVWLNEGFASYAEPLWFGHIGGETAYRDYMRSMDPYYYGGNFPGPLYEPDDYFNNTVYDKGAWVLHMLRHVLGDETFFQVLWDYGHHPEYQYGVANTAQFQELTENTSGVDLDWFFQEWIYGENRPYYEFWWRSDSLGVDSYQVTLHVDQIQTNAPVFRMPIDIQIETNSGETTFTVIDSLESQEFVFTLDTEPVDLHLDRYDWILKHRREIQPVGVGDDNQLIPIPKAFALHQNYPNPFNPSTVISFDIPAEFDGTGMRLAIYDLRGRRIRNLRSGPAAAGKNEVTWDGRDDSGRSMGSGIYLYRLEVGNRIETKRMVMLK